MLWCVGLTLLCAGAHAKAFLVLAFVSVLNVAVII